MAHAPSRFLSLPGELRNRIYELLLQYASSTSYIRPYTPWLSDDAPDLSSRNCLHPEILGTCRAVAFEASPTLYAKNIFALWADEASYFIRRIGKRNASLLKIVILTLEHVYRVPKHLELDRVFEHGATLKHLNVSIEFNLVEKTLDLSQQSVYDLLCKAQEWLAAHPSLNLSMSPHPTGQCHKYSHSTFLDISFVATQEDYYTAWEHADGPVVLDLNAIIYELGEQLKRPVQQRIYPIKDCYS
ncbi:MAG: hypothetical protein Q9184_006168 [Pyrenodesmia sp. 2 TL-2023]